MYKESRKMVLNLFAEPRWRCRLVRGKEQTCGHSSGRRGGMNVESSMESYRLPSEK